MFVSVIRMPWPALLLSLAMIAAAPAPAAPSTVPTPRISQAPAGTHGYPFPTTAQDIKRFGYVQKEVFLDGTARSYVPTAPMATIKDGRWDATPTGPSAPYKIRLIIRQPTDPAKFNGTVLFEWLNVSSSFDTDTFDNMDAWFLRSGYAYVGVSAQAAGVNYLKGKWDPARYDSLTHPGDSYSYDIFSQAAQAVRSGNPAPLGTLTSRIKAIIAWGGSQSGSRLITYINAVHPTAKVIDGFAPFITGGGAALSQAPLPAVAVPTGAQTMLRTDTRTPILIQNSESELANSARGLHAQPDSAYFRLWEFTGTSHANRDTVGAIKQRLEVNGVKSDVFPVCENPPVNNLNSFPAYRSSFAAIDNWVRRGRAPAHGTRVELVIPADPAQPATIVRDPATGIAKGGIKLPEVAVPTATLVGARPAALLQQSPNCRLFGAVDAWNADRDAWDGNSARDVSPNPEPVLAARYGTSANYVKAVQDAADRLVAQGFLLAPDAQQSVKAARAVTIR